MSKESVTKFLPLIILFIGIFLSISTALTINNFILSIEKQRFETAAKQIESEIDTNKLLLSILIKSIANTFVVSDHISEVDFEKLVKTISLEQNPFGIEMLGYAQLVKQKDKNFFEKKYNIKIHPETNNDSFPIIYQEPKRVDLEGAYGYDPFTNPARNQAMQKAINTQDIAMTSSVIFEFTGDKNSGLIYYYPIFKDNKLDGFIYVAVDIARFYNLALVKAYINCDFEIYEVDKEKRDLIFDSNPTLKDAKYQKIAPFLHNDQNRLAIFKSESVVNLGIIKHVDLFLLFVGFIVSILTSFVIRNLQRTRLRALAIASNMTKSFQEHIQTLEKSVIYLALDEDFNIVDISDAMCKLTLYSRGELLNKSYLILKTDNKVNYLEEIVQQLKKTYFWDGEFEISDKLGNKHWLSAKISTKLNKYGIPIGAMMVAEDITRRKKVEHIAITDKLTGIYNRAKLDSMLELFNKDGFCDSFSILILDIDKFKLVNDNHGHQAGDIILKEFTKIIKDNIRESDIFERWGGEEFMILAPNSHIESALLLAEKLRVAVENHAFPIIGKKTCSIGVSQHMQNENIEQSIEKADKALYLAKNSGRNRVCSQKDLG